MSLKVLVMWASLFSSDRHYPPAGDVCRFPPEKEIDYNISLAEERVKYIGQLMGIGPSWRDSYLLPAWRDMSYRLTVWKLMRSALAEGSERRCYLNSLRRLVGEEVYATGQWPHPLDRETLTEIEK